MSRPPSRRSPAAAAALALLLCAAPAARAGQEEVVLFDGATRAVLSIEEGVGPVLSSLSDALSPDALRFAPAALWSFTALDTRSLSVDAEGEPTAVEVEVAPGAPGVTVAGSVLVRAADAAQLALLVDAFDLPPSASQAAYLAWYGVRFDAEAAGLAEAPQASLDGETFAVEVVAYLDGEDAPGHLLLRPRVTALDDGHEHEASVGRLTFPIVEPLPLAPADRARERLAIPLHGGLVVAEPTRVRFAEGDGVDALLDHLTVLCGGDRVGGAERSRTFLRHPGPLNLQVLAYWAEEGTGSAPGPATLVFGTRDPHGWHKAFAARAVGATEDPAADQSANRLRLGVATHAPDRHLAGASYAMADLHPQALDPAEPFDFVLGCVRGGWLGAARSYRDWALAQPFAPPPLRDDPAYSAVVRAADAGGRASCDARLLPGPPGAPPLAIPLETRWSAWPETVLHLLLAAPRPPRLVTELVGWGKHDILGRQGDPWLEGGAGPDGGLTHELWAAADPAGFPGLLLHLLVASGHYGFGAYLNPFYVHADAPAAPGALTSAARRWDGSPVRRPDEYADAHAVAADPDATAYALVAADLYELDRGSDLVRAQVVEAARRLAAVGAGGLYLDTAYLTSDPHVFVGDVGRGGGPLATARAVEVLRAAKEQARSLPEVGDELWFMDEFPNEYAFGVFEWSYLVRYYSQALSGAGYRWRVPFTATVYRDRFRTVELEPLAAPEASVPAEDRDQMFFQRAVRALDLHLGVVPSYAFEVGDRLPLEYLTDPDLAPLAELHGLVASALSVVAHPRVRPFVALGELLAEPETSSARVDLLCGTGDPNLRGLVAPELVLAAGNGYDEPVVRASAHGDGSANRLGILLTNWTAPGDLLVGLRADATPQERDAFWKHGQTVPGDQHGLRVTVDAQRHGLAAGTYAVRLVDEGGVKPVPIDYLVLLPSGSDTVTLDVPALATRFLLIERLGG